MCIRCTNTHKTVKFRRFRHKISCICILIRYYFWLMVYIRIFDKFLFLFSLAISYTIATARHRTQTYTFTHTKSEKFHAMDLRLTPIWCVERVVELVYFSLFINNKSFYVRKNNIYTNMVGIFYLKNEPNVIEIKMAKVSYCVLCVLCAYICMCIKRQSWIHYARKRNRIYVFI